MFRRVCGSWQIAKIHIIVSNTLVCVCVEVVSSESEKIAAEELECKAMAENAQRDLDEALPALEEAMKVEFSPLECFNPASPRPANPGHCFFEYHFGNLKLNADHCSSHSDRLYILCIYML